MLGLFAVTATTAVPAVEAQAALSGVFLQIFNHGITAAALFYFVGLLEQRRGARGLNDFGGLMQRTPLLCGWMSVAMFSSLGLPGLNGFIGEFLIFKGSFALAAGYTAVAVLGLLVTAIVFLRAMQAALQRSARGKLRPISRSPPERKVGRRPDRAAHVRGRHLSAIRPQHLQRHRHADGAIVRLSEMSKANHSSGSNRAVDLLPAWTKGDARSGPGVVVRCRRWCSDAGSEAKRESFPERLRFSAYAQRVGKLEITNWHFKLGQVAKPSLRLHRTRRRHALERLARASAR